jgi:hypothetical protein
MRGVVQLFYQGLAGAHRYCSDGKCHMHNCRDWRLGKEADCSSLLRHRIWGWNVFGSEIFPLSTWGPNRLALLLCRAGFHDLSLTYHYPYNQAHMVNIYCLRRNCWLNRHSHPAGLNDFTPEFVQSHLLPRDIYYDSIRVLTEEFVRYRRKQHGFWALTKPIHQ